MPEEKTENLNMNGVPDVSSPESEEEKAGAGNSSRFREILGILKRNHVFQGITPEKLRVVLEELGPTFIKLGQIMSTHSDILPAEYCDELAKLNSDVTPMPFSDVISVIENSYREKWTEVFDWIDEVPLGSASIAQVHRARLKDGTEVIVKVERKGIYDTMARDIRLLQRAVKFLPSVGGLKYVADLGQVLDEMWKVAQQEMNFLQEADNMEEFARNNADVKFVAVPKLYREYTTTHVLVMEYIGGCAINDKKALLERGYDLHEVGEKLVDNFIKQVMDDGFFHADPHPGNVKVFNGKIVWIDMGMMGRLSDSDRKLLGDAIKGIADHDTAEVEQAILSIGDFRKAPDRDALYRDLTDILGKYGDTDITNVDIAQFFTDIIDTMKRHGIVMPHGLTMLARGLTHMEGDLAEISPDINMVEIAQRRILSDEIENFNLKKAVMEDGRKLGNAFHKSVEIPGLLERALRDYMNGVSHMSMELKTSPRLAWLLRKLVQNLVLGMWVMALLIASSILCMSDIEPKIFGGIPLLGFIGFACAGLIVGFLVIRHFVTKPRDPNKGLKHKKH
jgi:ubiquinone biosynthesis protein